MKFLWLAALLAVVFLSNCQKTETKTEGPRPKITDIHPLEGTVGDIIFIDGENFGWEPIVRVIINDSAAVVKRVSDTQMEVIVPENVEGTGDIVVTIGDTTIVWPHKFTYIIIKLTGPQTSTFAGGRQGFADGPREDAKFKLPQGVVLDSQGNLYVVDTDNLRIRKISTEGEVSTLAGNGGYGIDDGPGDQATFKYPVGIAIGPDGNLYIAGNQSHVIRKITPDGEVSTLAGTGDAGYQDGPAAEAMFFQPVGIASDQAGNLYVTEYSNHTIRKISTDGMVTTVAGGEPGYADGTGSGAKFYNPYGITIDADGNLYVCDRTNARIRKITPDGVVTTVAGSDQGNIDGTGPAAKFNQPSAICMDTEGNILVGEDHGLRKVTPQGVVTTIVGGGEPGFADGQKEEAKFNEVCGIAVGTDGIIYLGDRSNNRIRRIEILDD